MTTQIPPTTADSAETSPRPRRERLRRPLALAVGSAAAIALIAAGGLTAANAATTAGAGSLVIIDAKTDANGAADAMKLYGGASNSRFTPTAAPVYAQTGWSPVYDYKGELAPSVTGKPDQPMQETVTVSHAHNTSWSLGTSLTTTAGFSVLDAVNSELSATFTAKHTWSASDGDGQSITVNAEPGKTVWLEENVSTATITGDFTFDVDGTHYEVDNVSITQPASEATGTKAAAAYRVMEQPSTSLGLPANAGGIMPISSIPKLQQYIAQGH
ncbi:conserved exported hypothetical protein [Microbacterium sp. 8M]|uniref:hypothetical protein n=1 Tax=Microbacterium sp. 8M TaxID=2653153 RepID=UPI0012F09B0C|nr:hypothetical protein [Microbacterium sp. 8M]VXC27462.1 conserved exported hypothetical protein [Microbacterium sp. 8M]